ncbi:MAG: sugar transferase [Candidatus Omnitrophica bacterium]|nr:sugar transferase [Candidatus Omnitrophota bacterium]
MFRVKSRTYLAYIAIDIVFILASFYWPFKFNPALVPQGHLPAIRSYLAVCFFWGIILLFYLQGALLYRTDRYLSISKEWWKVLRCVLYASVLTILFIYILKIGIFSRLVFIESTVLLSLSLPAWRTIKRLYVRYLVRSGYANYNVLIIGAGGVGLSLAEEIRSFPYLGIKIVGFLDDAKTGSIDGSKILGRIDDIERIVNKYFIDEIYVTIPSERKITADIIQKGTKLGRTVRIVAEHFSLPYRHVKLNHVGIIPLMTYFEKNACASESITKRSLDVIISGSALIFLLPLFAITAYLIKLESRGPVFYVSKRSGKNGIAFNLYKFRSMAEDADSRKEALKNKSEVEGPIFKIRNDPRLTGVGKFLRKFSIDELPQLINVLKGDMSLVGPRPFPVEESNEVEYRHIPRLNIRPGMTGLAQVKGRSDLKFNNWMRWDIWYIDNWSLGLDSKILLWTIPAVLKGKGAY